MRNGFSILLTVALILMVAGSALAELNMEAKSFYGQGILTLPTGDFFDFAGTGFGAGLGMSVPYSELLNFRGEFGYIMYGGKDFGTSEYTFSMIPITVLGEYHMDATNPAYLLGGLGLTIVKSSWEGTYDILGTTFTIDEDASSSEIGLTLGGGYEVNEKFNIEGRLNIISDTNYLSIHGTYAF